jgi:prepilin-type N-terminal cleavage/methylation domain-containing protein
MKLADQDWRAARRSRAFTLVELLVVIAIIGVTTQPMRHVDWFLIPLGN